MEAGTGGTPAADPQAELSTKLTTLEQGIEAMRARVNGDLEALKAELQAEHDRNDNVDLTAVMERIDIIINTVALIDPSSELPPEVRPGQQAGDGTGHDVPPVEAPPVEQPPAGEVPPPVEEPPADQPPEPTEGSQGEQVPPPAGQDEVARALYVFDGDPADVDNNEWPASGLRTPDGQPLFYYVMDDAASGTANGDGAGGRSGVWHVYQGPTEPVDAGI